MEGDAEKAMCTLDIFFSCTSNTGRTRDLFQDTTSRWICGQ